MIINQKDKRLEYDVDDVKEICMNDDCFIDKSEVRQLLLDVIENFNKANPHYKINTT